MSTRKTLWSLGIDLDTGPNGDAWGSSMGALFDIAHAIEHYGKDYPPAHWQYRDSIACHGLDRDELGENDQARTIAAAILRGREAEITHAGNVLDRYVRCLDRAGRSY